MKCGEAHILYLPECSRYSLGATPGNYSCQMCDLQAEVGRFAPQFVGYQQVSLYSCISRCLTLCWVPVHVSVCLDKKEQKVSLQKIM